MKKIFCLLPFISSLAFADPNPDFQNFLNTWRSQNHITAVVVSVENLDTHTITDYASGTTTLQGVMPVSPQNLFGVGSITKTFVAASILQLQEQGKLNLQDPIGPYFPEYPAWGNITILQLLNMTSGIANFTESPQFTALQKASLQALIAPNQLLNIAYQAPLYFAPGQGWHYSNTDYYLLGLIVQQVTKQPLADVFTERFFVPLHLEHSFYSTQFYPEKVTQNMAHAYINTQDVTNFNAGFYGPAGAMVMDSHDLLTWAHALFTPGVVLTQNSIRELEHTVAVPPSPPKPIGAQYGLGIYALKLPKIGMIWYYAGVINGYTSAFVWVPSEHKIISAQVSSWPLGHYEVLFPNQALMQKLLD